MIRINAPSPISNSHFYKPSLFLAGGITNTPVWQDVVCDALQDLDIVVLNPRRKDWPDDPAEIKRQIQWEYRMLRHADMIAFWFPKESVCPISLFELGSIEKLIEQIRLRLY